MEEELLWAATMVGTVACGITGALMAVDRGLDLLGVLVLGTVTAVGGGVLRDVLLGRTPPQAFTDSEFLMAAAGVSLLVFLVALGLYTKIQYRRKLVDTIINVFDAVGLGAYAVVGVRVAVDCGYADNGLLVLFMGVITAVGGGLLRDTLLCRVPFILHRRVYVVAALAGCIVYYTAYRWHELAAMITGILTVTAIRMLASIFRWDMPRIRPFEG